MSIALAYQPFDQRLRLEAAADKSTTSVATAAPRPIPAAARRQLFGRSGR